MLRVRAVLRLSNKVNFLQDEWVLELQGLEFLYGPILWYERAAQRIQGINLKSTARFILCCFRLVYFEAHFIGKWLVTFTHETSFGLRLLLENWKSKMVWFYSYWLVLKWRWCHLVRHVDDLLFLSLILQEISWGPFPIFTSHISTVNFLFLKYLLLVHNFINWCLLHWPLDSRLLVYNFILLLLKQPFLNLIFSVM